jgi:hypothetical protein
MSFPQLNSQYLNEAVTCEQKWNRKCADGSLYLGDIRNRDERRTAAVLLENQLLADQSSLFMEQSTDTGDIAQFKRISIPLVRRIYPQLIANKIVSVQPLLGPTGLVYYLRFRYASNKGATRGATQAGFPNDDALSLQQLASGDANLDIWYSHQFISSETQSNAGGGTALQYTLEKTPVLAGTITGSIYDGGVLVYTFVVSQAGTFTFTSVGSPSPTVSAGAINLVTGVMTLTWSADPGANSVVVNYEYNLEGQQDLPEVNLVVESEDVVAITRKLKAVWTMEAQQDIRSQHNLDAEAELTAILAQEINLEIDREVLTDLRNNAGTVAAWDFNTALGDTIKEKYEALYVKLVELSAVIHRKTLRGGANWIVTSPEVASIFETATAGYAPTMSDTFTTSLGIQYVGTINSKWRLYKDPLFPTNQILCGYKGDSYMDSGYFYMPYVPLTQTPVVLGPDDFVPRKGIMTRYGKKLLRDGAKFYGRLSVANYVI